jgi:hypothetical protein
MSPKSFAIALAALALAGPAAAQQRGTMELGAFGSGARFDQKLSLKYAVGAGGHVGMFLDRRWSLEFEKSEMRATRPDGLKDVNVGILAARFIANDFRVGAFTWFVGVGGGVSTETNFMHTYGVDVIGGTRIRLSSRYNLRVDAVADFLANEDWKSYQTVRIGLSWFRHPDM